MFRCYGYHQAHFYKNIQRKENNTARGHCLTNSNSFEKNNIIIIWYCSIVLPSNSNFIHFHTKHKLKLCLNSCKLHNDICKVEVSICIILISLAYFCEDIHDDGHRAETCSMIMWRQDFTINIQLCLTVSICWLFTSDNTTWWLCPRWRRTFIVFFSSF
jgi:hypothetical protein